MLLMRGGHHSSVKTMVHDFSLGAESTLESIDDISVVVDFVQGHFGLTVRRILARPLTPAPPPRKSKTFFGTDAIARSDNISLVLSVSASLAHSLTRVV